MQPARYRLLELSAYGSPYGDTSNMYRGDKSIGGLGIAGGRSRQGTPVRNTQNTALIFHEGLQLF